MIFDDKTRRADCLTVDNMSWNTLVEGYRWSADNSAEIERGWIATAATIRELAGKIGRDPDQLATTVERFNDAARNGHDSDFGRSADRMEPIEQPPYYAVEIVPGLVASTGGAKRDTHSRVLDHDDTPIPRLYEAGELGSTFANLYQNGSFLTECIVFGRIAGRNAVQQTNWNHASDHAPVRRRPRVT
jgi:succinate dehydrogenase/fumarate reductase flavoprotein subunit